jgi:TP901 family phage tail tape measure protein
MADELNFLAVLDDAEWAAALDAMSGSLDELAATMAATTEAMVASLDGVTGSLDGLMGSMDAAVGAIDANTASIDANSAAMDGNAAATDGAAAAHRDGANSAGALGGAFALVTAAAAAAGVMSIKMAGDFQSGITTLVTGAGEAQSNMQLVSNGILDLATSTGESTKQLIDGMFMIESAGFHGAAGLNVLKAAAEGAKVGNADLASVANGVTTEMTDFARSNLSAADATNILIATVAAGKTHMQDLANSMASILPTASAARVGLIDVQAAMATMTGEGVPAANAATYLRQTIIALDAPSKQTKKALEEVGLSSLQVSADLQKSLPDTLKEITDAVGKKFPVGSAQYVEALKNIAGGSKQMQGILDLTGDHMATFQGNVVGITDAVKQGSGSITGWSLVLGDFNTHVDQARERIQTFAIEMGTKLLPDATKLVDLLSTHLGPAFGALGIAAGGAFLLTKPGAAILKELGGVIEGTGGVFQSFIKGAQGAGGAASSFIQAVGRGKDVLTQSIFDGVKVGVKSVGSAFTEATRVTRDFAGTLGTNLRSALASLPSPMQMIENGFGALGKASGALQGGMGKFFELNDRLFSSLSRIPSPVQMIENGFGALGKVTNVLQGGMSSFFELNDRLFAMLTNKQAILGALKGGFSAVFDAVKGLLPAIGGLVQGGFSSLFSVIAGGLPALAGMASTLVAFLGPILLVAGAIALGVIIFMNFRKELEQLGAYLIGSLKPQIDGIKAVFVAFLDNVKAQWAAVWPKLKPAVEDLMNAMRNLAPVLQIVGTVIQAVFSVVLAVLGAVIGAFLNALPSIAGFFSAVFRIFGDLARIIQDVFQGKFGAIPALVGQIFGQIGLLIRNAVQAIVGFVVNMSVGILNAFNSMTGGALTGIINFVGGIIKWFTHLWSELVGHSIVPDMVTSIIEWILSLPTKILGGIATFITTLIANFISLSTKVVAAILQMVTSLVTNFLTLEVRGLQIISGFIVSAVGNFLGFAQKTLDAIVMMVAQLIVHFLRLEVQGWAIILRFVGNVIATVVQFVDRIIAAGVALVTGFISVLAALPGKAIALAQQTGQGILNAFSSLGTALTQIGGQLIQGLVNGITNAVGAAVNAAKNAASSVVDAAKSAFGIHSPSTVFHEIGINTMLGMARGIDTGTNHGLDAMKRATGAVIGAGITGGLGVGLRGSGPGNDAGITAQNLTITMNLQGGLGAGLQLLNPGDRQRFVRDITDEMGRQLRLQVNASTGYSGG